MASRFQACSMVNRNWNAIFSFASISLPAKNPIRPAIIIWLAQTPPPLATQTKIINFTEKTWEGGTLLGTVGPAFILYDKIIGCI